MSFNTNFMSFDNNFMSFSNSYELVKSIDVKTLTPKIKMLNT